jgi:hypothetical protein
MRNAIAFIAILGSVGPSGPAMAQAATAPGTTPSAERCVRYQGEYEKLEKRLAQSAAEGALGSAKSLKLRSVEDASLVALAQFSLDGLKSAGCPLPDGPPSALPFLLAALKCERARHANGQAAPPPACDQARWLPFKE